MAGGAPRHTPLTRPLPSRIFSLVLLLFLSAQVAADEWATSSSPCEASDASSERLASVCQGVLTSLNVSASIPRRILSCTNLRHCCLYDPYSTNLRCPLSLLNITYPIFTHFVRLMCGETCGVCDTSAEGLDAPEPTPEPTSEMQFWMISGLSKKSTSFPSNRGEFTLSSNGVVLNDTIFVGGDTSLIIRGDGDALPTIKPAYYDDGGHSLNDDGYRLFLVRGELHLERVRLLGGIASRKTTGPAPGDPESTSLILETGNQIYLGDGLFGAAGYGTMLNITDCVLENSGDLTWALNHQDELYPGGSIVSMSSRHPAIIERANRVYFSNTTSKNHVHSVGSAIGAYGSDITFRGGRNILWDNKRTHRYLSGNQIFTIDSVFNFTECPPGKYFDSPMPYGVDAEIVGCPDECEPGAFGHKYEERVDSCSNCPSGYYCPETTATPTPCSKGKYNEKQRITDVSGCTACPAGYYVGETASPLCFPCVPGEYENELSSENCKACAKGQYMDEKNATSCKVCPPGESNDKNRSASCEKCKSGYYGVATGCAKCPAGFVRGSDASAEKCIPCDKGWYQKKEAQAACLPCVPGKFQSKFHSMSCKACAEGTFQRLSNSTTCEICPEGYYQAESSAPMCFPCSPGKTQSVQGQRSCENCADGKYQSEAGQTTCNTPDKTKVAIDGVAAIRIPPGFEAISCDSSVCTDYKKCQSGYFSDFSDDGRPECKKCVDAVKYGYGPGYESLDGSTTCTACPKGRYLEHGKDRCEDCDIGYFQPDVGQTTCIRCPTGWRGETKGESACIDKGWENPEDCDDMEYLDRTDLEHPDEWKCEPCPIGGTCSGPIDQTQIDALPGWWKVPIQEREPEREIYVLNVFAQCAYPSACENNATANVTCSVRLGFKEASRLCHACASDFRRHGLHQCAKCPDAGQNWSLIFLGIIVILGVLIYMINSTLSEGLSLDLSQSVTRILLNYLQVISLSRTFPLRWPKELTTLFQMQGSMSTLGEHIVNVDCVVGTGSSAGLFYEKLVFFALLPAGVSVVAFCFWYLYGIRNMTHFFAKRATRSEKTPKDKWIVSVGVMLFLLYPTLCEETFSTFSCKWVGMKQYLQVDLEEPCFEGRHETMILALAVPLLLVYVIGLPALVLLFLIRNNTASSSRKYGNDDSGDRLSGTGLFGNPIAITRWGLFFKGYKPERFYWESIIVSRKVCMVALSVFGKELGAERQSQVVLLLLLVCIVLEIAGEPFKEVTKAYVVLKRLELGALLVEWGTFWCGLMIYQSGPKSKGMNSFMTAFVFTMNAILLIGFAIVLLGAYAEERKLQKSSVWQKMEKMLSRKRLSSMSANSRDVRLPSDRSQVNIRQRTFDSEANSSVSNPCMMIGSALAAEVEMTSIGEPSKRRFSRHEADDGSNLFAEVATDESAHKTREVNLNNHLK